MKLADLQKVYDSLEECSVDVEEFSWGPCYEFAMNRRQEALAILSKEIDRRRNRYGKGSNPT